VRPPWNRGPASGCNDASAGTTGGLAAEASLETSANLCRGRKPNRQSRRFRGRFQQHVSPQTGRAFNVQLVEDHGDEGSKQPRRKLRL
jgi:hypothetical protein